jgi:peptidoglycan/xylan/chitin deacetylase (PgdA/CDA1 family)
VTLVRWMGRIVSRGSSRLSILIFHRVRPVRDELFPEEPDAARFESLLRRLRSSFQVLPLADAVADLQRGALPPNALAITFDDGYADNQQVAAPILKRLGLHATFFVATGFLDGGRMWNDTVIESLRGTRLERLDLSDEGLGVHEIGSTAQRRVAIDRLLRAIKHLAPAERLARVQAIAARCPAALPADLMMSTIQLQALQASGMAIGGHTVNHPILCSVPDAEARQEIGYNKHRLEALLQSPVSVFAYPNGKPDVDFAARHAAMAAQAGYTAAVTTASGAARPGDDPMQLPRFTPWDRGEFCFALRLVANLRTPARLAT